jgi:hypothetical protein
MGLIIESVCYYHFWKLHADIVASYTTLVAMRLVNTVKKLHACTTTTFGNVLKPASSGTELAIMVRQASMRGPAPMGYPYSCVRCRLCIMAILASRKSCCGPLLSGKCGTPSTFRDQMTRRCGDTSTSGCRDISNLVDNSTVASVALTISAIGLIIG